GGGSRGRSRRPAKRDVALAGGGLGRCGSDQVHQWRRNVIADGGYDGGFRTALLGRRRNRGHQGGEEQERNAYRLPLHLNLCLRNFRRDRKSTRLNSSH